MTQSSGKPPSSPEPSFQEKAAEILLKAVMVGGISAGGVGAFWKLFVNSDLPQAIASLFIGGGISYGAAMLGPIHTVNMSRVRHLGEVIDQGIDWVTLTLIKEVQGIENKYLLC